MRNKIRISGSVVGIALVAVASIAAPASAYPPPITGVGTVSCAVKASLTFSPPLQYPGSNQVETITLKSSLIGCSGTGDGANVKSGSSTVVSTATTNDCIAIVSSPPTGQAGDIKWKSLPHTSKLVNSTVQFDSASYALGPPITSDASGSAIGGSFNGDPAAAHSLIKETYETLQKKCTTSGLKSLHVLPSGSTFTLSSPPS